MKLRSKKHIGLGYRENRYPAYFIVLTVLFILLLIYLAWPINIIDVSDTDNATMISIILEPNSEFYIDYTHSVMKTTVRDVFKIKKRNTLLLTRTEYSSFGAGLPTESYGSFKLENGMYINDGINMELSNLPIRVGSIANHRIVFEKGRELFLSDYVESRSLINIRPVRITRLQAFFIEGRIRSGQ